MEILNLNLIKKWYDMTKSGVKKEEYRELTPFWAKRLLNTPFSHMRGPKGSPEAEY